MGWIHRDSYRHRCKTPGLDPKSCPGDVWECDACSAIFIVKDDQRDGPYLEQVTDTKRAEALRYRYS